jgi:tetratricopeptide (TPR) repeat protein
MWIVRDWPGCHLVFNPMNQRSKKYAGRGKAAAVHSSAPVSPADWNNRWLVFGVCLFLAAMIWAVFGQTLGHEFVNYDDSQYVSENPVVQKGLTWEGFRWALTYGGIGHWHPLTWLSHMLDCQLYGLNPGGHHFTNVLLHTATTILLFLILRRMTGFLWRSAFVAAVFAIHPLRAESVAWVAERKDVLNGLFFMLTLWAYTRYVASDKCQVTRTDPHSSLVTHHSSLFYCLVPLFFALGLLSKNMLVTMPFVLLLLDYWPLGRLSSFTPQVFSRLVAEKIPLLVLTVASCVVTFLVPEKLTAADKLPFGLRLENAVVSYVIYLWQMIHPTGLAGVYPNPENYLPFWQVGGAMGLLLAITGAAWALRQTHRWFVVGWLWYVGMMVPVIGVVQISYYAHADRYTYLPEIGLYLLLTWAAADLCAGWRYRRLVVGGLATVILAALIFCARTQTSYWRNSELLWTHTLACTSDNYIAHNNLGDALPQKEKADEAIVHYQTALHIKPDYADACYNLGNALFQKGKVDEAIAHYQTALQINPGNAEAHNNLGYALFKTGNGDEAIVQYQKALEIKPDFAYACYNLGDALFQKGRVDEAITQYQKALQINPGIEKAHNNLGNTLLQLGRVNEAIVQYQQALQISPNYAGACYNLGTALLQKGEVDQAIPHFRKALQIKPDFAEAHTNLDIALRQQRKVDEALARYQQALQIRPDSVEALNNLAWLLATCPDAHIRDGVQAVKYAERACELTHYGVTVLVGTLAAAYAEAGRYDDAIATAQKACALAEKSGDRDLLERNQKLLALYRVHQPYHEAAGKPVPAAS